MNLVAMKRFAAVVALALTVAPSAFAAEIRVLTAGAFKAAVLAIQPDFERETGHKLVVDNDTAGGVARRVDAGEAFDVVIVTPAGIDAMVAKGKVVAGSRRDVARTGVGVMVKEGAPKPDIASVEAFKATLLNAKSISYIDPASGGSSGIYLAALFEKMDIAEALKPKSKLKGGGYVADLISSGEAEIGLHQISEIIPAKGVTLVGPLPAAVQTYTTYSSGLGANAKDAVASQALLAAFVSSKSAAMLKAMGMETGI